MNYPEFVTKANDFAMAVFQCFSQESGYTDIYVQPDKQLKARRGTDSWESLDFPQIDGLGEVPDHLSEKYQNRPQGPIPFIIGSKQFNSIMAEFFEDQEWAKLVDKNGGCLYPVFSIDDQSTDEEVETDEGIETDTAIQDNQLYRLRITLQKQDMGKYGMMMRCLRPVNQSLEELGLPSILKEMLSCRSGLILITGSTGAGKSTTMAGIIDLFNTNRKANIVLIEDPVEFLHSPKQSSITYREVGTDIDNFADGVNQVLRFVPDVIGIGEIREARTMQAALRAAESGHLVVGTIHAPTTFNAIRKGLSFLETNGEKMSFGSSLVGVIAQTLVPRFADDGVTIDGKALAYEILDLSNKTGALSSAVERSISSNSTGLELQNIEKEFIAKPGEMGVAGAPYSLRIGDLVRKGLIDHRYVLNLCDVNSRKSIEEAGVKHLRRREQFRKEQEAATVTTSVPARSIEQADEPAAANKPAAPAPAPVPVPVTQSPPTTPVSPGAAAPADPAPQSGFVQAPEPKRGILGGFFGGSKN